MTRRKPFPAHRPITATIQFTRWRVRRLAVDFPSLLALHEWLGKERRRWRDPRTVTAPYGPNLKSARGTTLAVLEVVPRGWSRA